MGTARSVPQLMLTVPFVRFFPILILVERHKVSCPQDLGEIPDWSTAITPSVIVQNIHGL